MITKDRIKVFISLLGVILCTSLYADAPTGWKDKCFGRNQFAGSASFEITGGMTNLTVEGGGTDIWGNDDYGRYVFTPFAGDCEIIATIPYIPTNTTDYGYWLRTGVMMRGSTMHGGQNVAALRARGDVNTGNRNKFTKRLTCRGSTSDFDDGGEIAYAPDRGVRMRLIRQGNTFSAWCSTNAPAYDFWELQSSEYDSNNDYTSAMNLGVVVSRWQDLGPDTYTATFTNVIARNLVNVSPSGGSINIDWIGDAPVGSGSIVGYSVNRTRSNSPVFNVITNLDASTLSYTDSSAGNSTSYVYRIYAQVENGAVTNDVLVGTSLAIRNASSSGNLSPSPVQGIAAQYYDTNTDYDSLVSARVDPYMDNSWNLNTSTVYPNGTGNGLSNLDTFRVRWNGNVIVDESGCYEILVYVDDIANVYVDGERLVYHNEYQNGNWIYTAPFYLEAGRTHTIQCDVQENTGGEAMRVNWFKADGTGSESRMPQTVFEPFPLPWQHKDIGDSPFLGNANFDESDLSFNLAAGIGDIDNQHFAWRESSTDFDFMASAELTNPGASGVNAGLAVRSSTAMGSQAVSVALVSDGAGGTDRKIEVAIRDTDNGTVSESSVSIGLSIADLRLSRRNDSLLVCYRTGSSGGWVVATNLTIDLPDTVCVGMQSYSATESLLSTNTFSAVTFSEDGIAALNVTAANLEADISTPGNPLKVEQDKADLPNVAWYWYSDTSAVVDDSFTVCKSDHWDNDYTVLATLNAGNGYSYTDTLAASNTVYFYKMYYTNDFGAFADSSANDMYFTSARVGVSDGSINAGGTGLYTSFYRGIYSYFPTGFPVHVETRGLGGWEKGVNNNPIITAANSDDGQQIGPDNFVCSWTGTFVPPYTGYYSFRMQTDDAKVLFLDGALMIESYGYVADYTYSPELYLEAGQSLPIHVYFQQGTGGGFFRMWWKTGVGTDAEYVAIPDSTLLPLATEDTAFVFAPGGANEFGEWKNIDINAKCAGHAIVTGTPDLFDCKIVGGGGDIWGSADGLHYIYQETSDNFEMEGTFNSVINANSWTKLGLMVRESSASNSREISLIQSTKNGRHTQLRSATGGSSINLDTYNRTLLNDGVTTAYPPVRFKIVRKDTKVYTYLNDVLIPQDNKDYFDISAWSSTVMIGICLTAHENNCLSEALVNDVTFTILRDKGTTVLIK